MMQAGLKDGSCCHVSACYSHWFQPRPRPPPKKPYQNRKTTIYSLLNPIKRMFQILPPPGVFTGSWHLLMYILPGSAHTGGRRAPTSPQEQLSKPLTWQTLLPLSWACMLFCRPAAAKGPGHSWCAFLSWSRVRSLQRAELPKPTPNPARLSKDVPGLVKPPNYCQGAPSAC